MWFLGSFLVHFVKKKLYFDIYRPEFIGIKGILLSVSLPIYYKYLYPNKLVKKIAIQI